MKKQILIVDDEIEVGEVILDIIESVDSYEAQYVPSAKEAIKLLKEKTYDLVITDLLMPEFNGIELTDYIYSNYKSTTKVLACSGGGQSGKLVAGMALDQALEEGAANAILKPFSAEELLTKVINLIGK